jgi:hypothetical protein
LGHHAAIAALLKGVLALAIYVPFKALWIAFDPLARGSILLSL